MESQMQSIKFLSAKARMSSGIQIDSQSSCLEPNKNSHQIFSSRQVKPCLRGALPCGKMRRNVSFNSEVAQKSFSPNLDDHFLDRFGPTGPMTKCCGYLKFIKLQIPIIKYINWIKKYDLAPNDLEVEIYCLGQGHNIPILNQRVTFSEYYIHLHLAVNIPLNWMQKIYLSVCVGNRCHIPKLIKDIATSEVIYQQYVKKYQHLQSLSASTSDLSQFDDSEDNLDDNAEDSEDNADDSEDNAEDSEDNPEDNEENPEDNLKYVKQNSLESENDSLSDNDLYSSSDNENYSSSDIDNEDGHDDNQSKDQINLISDFYLDVADLIECQDTIILRDFFTQSLIKYIVSQIPQQPSH